MAAGGGKSFAAAFWHDYDLGYTRATRGRHDLKRLKQFLEDRATIEEGYAKGLLKLAKASEFEVKGSLGSCWTHLLETTRSIAQQHQQAAAAFAKEIAKTLDGEMKTLKASKTAMQKAHNKLRDVRTKRNRQHKQAKKKYYDTVADAETAVVNRDAGVKERVPDQKLKQLESRVKSLLKDVEKTHRDYQAAVGHLKSAQEEYDQGHAAHMAQFENMETKRGVVLTEQFARLQQVHDLLRGTYEEVTIGQKAAVDAVTHDEDMAQYVSENESKESPPPHVEYVPCQSAIIDHARGIVPSANAGAMNGGGAAPAAQQQRAAAPAAAAAAPAAAPVAAAVAGGGGGGGGGGLGKARALYDFKAEQDDELGFSKGDVIDVDEMDGDWWKGRLNGKSGSFPANHVEKIAGGGGGGGGGAPAASAAAAASPAAAQDTSALEAMGTGGDQPKLMDGKCQALYNFVAQSNDELSFTAGDILHVTGELNGWYLGRTEDGSEMGIFPSNHVAML